MGADSRRENTTDVRSVIVYGETNFLLELALLQEEHEACEEILRLAEQRTIRLVFPAFSLIESYMALEDRQRQRLIFRQRLTSELAELSRSKPHAEVVEESRDLARVLLSAVEGDAERLDTVIGRVSNACESVALDPGVVDDGRNQAKVHDLSAQDSVVYASVRSHMGTEDPAGPKVFLNRNTKDFLRDTIQSELDSYNCRLIPSFRDGLGFIESRIRL